MTCLRSSRISALGRTPWPRRALTVVAAVLLGMPGAAYPISLSQLLRLPLEELLRLELSGPVSDPRPRSGAPAALPTPSERRIA